MTELSDSDLRDLVESVWTVTLGFEVLDPAGSIPPPPDNTLCGCVHLSGAWQGLVSVRVSENLARNVAATMFDTSADAIGNEELHDALGEIANMTAGSVKALLPGPSSLSLPSVVSGSQFSFNSPGGEIVNELSFQCHGSRITVQVIKARRAGRLDALSA
jgi:chemotaxis protein CheX